MSQFLVLFSTAPASAPWGGAEGLRQELSRGFSPANLSRLERRTEERNAHRETPQFSVSARRVPFNSWCSPGGEFAVGLHANPPPDYPSSPVHLDPERNLVLSWYGSIFNVEELSARIGLSPDPFRSIHQVLVESYLHWGDGFVEQLDGDFVVVIWDQEQRRVLVCRDSLGIKCCYYFWDGSTLVVASNIAQLLALSFVPSKLDVGFFSEYLICAVTSRTDTIYQSIKRLPPANIMTVAASGLSFTQYWDLLPRSVSFGAHSIQASILQYRELFFQAVERRMRGHRRIAAQLSGGLDSSSIVVAAANLSESGSLTATRLNTFSLVFPGRSCDESEYSDALVKALQLEHTTLAPTFEAPDWAAAEVAFTRDVPNYPNGLLGMQSIEQIKAKGFDHVLCGLGGDEFTTGGAFLYRSLLSRGSIRALLQQARSDQRLRNSVSDVLPGFIKRLARSVVPSLNWIPPWVTTKLVRESGIAERLRAGCHPPSATELSLQQYRIYHACMNGWAVHIREIEARAAALAGVEFLYPFFDRELVEFSYSLPPELLHRDGFTKFVLREAFRGVMPDQIRQRKTKADFSFIGVELLEAVGGRSSFESLALYDTGWIDRQQVLSMYDRMLRHYRNDDPRYIDPSWTLWNIYGCNLVLNY